MSSRRSVRRLVLSAVLGIGLVVLVAGPAAAHVEIDPGSVPKGSTTSFSFRVPNEKDNASTVSLEVDFPTDHPIPAVSVLVKQGWSFTVEKQPLQKPIKTESGEVTEAVSKITWTGGQIPPDGYDPLSRFGGALPKKGKQRPIKGVRTHSEGGAVQW